ncbi:dual specificity protein phosphatase 19a [Latimeria chalumnae]|uniref:Dual specificity protein phosphatase 19 n=1 Tax=Latimeria chalumnae TaxID=7897 RepID=H3AGV5_LATCH|nr:PREDICTED: dual specificity protein phosphatase 19 [Latimeria chalumnae]|eukprot:XP_005999735.1 PREDICTED: dual specificity protein phosphatase 19 [Latimeria chalumnae]
MHSLAQEIKTFSKSNLKKQCTRITTLSGKRIIERWKDSRVQVVEETEEAEGGCGFVRDLSLDLQVGLIKPWLFLASQDVAHDLETLKKHTISHILNLAYGVENAFPIDFTYKSISILDLPETDIVSYFQECFEFIEEAKVQDKVVLVHCNAGVSRSASVVIGYLMYTDRLAFREAYSVVKGARPAVCPNPGFMEQLKKYQPNNRRQLNGNIHS